MTLFCASTHALVSFAVVVLEPAVRVGDLRAVIVVDLVGALGRG